MRAELRWVCSICSWASIVREVRLNVDRDLFSISTVGARGHIRQKLDLFEITMWESMYIEEYTFSCVIFLWKYWNTGFQIQIPGVFLQVTDKVILKSLTRDYWLCRSHMCYEWSSDFAPDSHCLKCSVIQNCMDHSGLMHWKSFRVKAHAAAVRILVWCPWGSSRAGVGRGRDFSGSVVKQ